MCVCVCICIHVCMYVYVYVYVYVYIYMCMHVSCVCVHAYVYMCMYIYKSIYVSAERLHAFTGVVEHHAWAGVYVDRCCEYQRTHLLHARYRMCICAIYIHVVGTDKSNDFDHFAK